MMASDKIQINRHVHFKKTLEDVGEPRVLVEDTGKYLNKSLAFVETDYFKDDNKLSVTGFLCENILFITDAHIYILMIQKVDLSMHYVSFLKIYEAVEKVITMLFKSKSIVQSESLSSPKQHLIK